MNLWNVFAQLQVTGRNPITAITGWFHSSMNQAGSDLVGPLIIIGAIMGMFKGWLGVLAGGALGCVIAIIVANADAIRDFGRSIVF